MSGPWAISLKEAVPKKKSQLAEDFLRIDRTNGGGVVCRRTCNIGGESGRRKKGGGTFKT